MTSAFSRIVAAIAYVGPPVWAYFAIKADYTAQVASGGLRCGTVAVGNYILGMHWIGLVVRGCDHFSRLDYRSRRFFRTDSRVGRIHYSSYRSTRHSVAIFHIAPSEWASLAGRCGLRSKIAPEVIESALTETPNKALEPTVRSVTPRANARVAPVLPVAHL